MMMSMRAALPLAAFLAALGVQSSAQTEITPGSSAVTASANDGNLPGNVVDNNLGTRWSADGDGQWLQIDLGTVRSVGSVRVAVYNGNTRRNRFELQLATVAGSWTSVFNGESTGTTTAEQTYDFTDQDARFVRYLGHGSSDPAKPTMNSVTEISIFAGTAPPTATPTPTSVPPTPTPTTEPTATPTPDPPPPVVDLTPGTAGVTASTNDGNVPGNTVDNNLGTRWSANGDGQWIRYDLGTVNTVAYLKIAVYNGNTRQNRFDLQVSNDGTSWTNVLTNGMTSGTTTNLETHDVVPDVSARYVRYVGHGSTANMFNSVTEVEIWGAPCSTCPTPVPTATPTATPTSSPTPTPTPTSTPGGGGPTDGWTQRSWTYTMHKPWNQPLENRFSYSNGVWTCWLFPNDPPFQPPPKEGGPRTELRWQNDYTSGQRMWDSDIWVVSPTQSTVMQLFGGTETQTGYQIRSFSDGTLRRYNSATLISNAFGKWINAKVAHNVSTHTVRSYINDAFVRQDPDRGPPTNVGAYYFKNGLYGCSEGRCEDRFRNTKQWTR
jgi:hypothetical protein